MNTTTYYPLVTGGASGCWTWWTCSKSAGYRRWEGERGRIHKIIADKFKPDYGDVLCT